MNKEKKYDQQNLEYLFDIQLDYKEGKPPISTDGKVGKLIGSGEGKVDGPRIRGKVHWTLFESQSDIFCASNLFGVITTDDDAEIKFDSMGFFQRPDKGAHIWKSSAGVSFETNDER